MSDKKRKSFSITVAGEKCACITEEQLREKYADSDNYEIIGDLDLNKGRYILKELIEGCDDTELVKNLFPSKATSALSFIKKRAICLFPDTVMYPFLNCGGFLPQL